MADLSTSYMGLPLDNPIIVSSSSITGSEEGVRSCADAGVGAVVLKSMFEEIILAQSERLNREMMQAAHTEALDYVQSQIGMQMGTKPYLKFIESVKAAVDIPVIASINCSGAEWWTSYAADIESAGADGIELNISHFPGPEEKSVDIENRYADIVAAVCDHVAIPVAVKLGSYFTSLWRVLEGVVTSGAEGLVLFNRFYTVDVDVEKQGLVPVMRQSCSNEKFLPMKWTALASERYGIDIASSTGIHSADDILKMIMAGASAVQICSVLYRHGTGYIGDLRQELNDLMDKRGFAFVTGLKGAALKNTPDHDRLLHRLQYIKALNEAAEYEI